MAVRMRKCFLLRPIAKRLSRLPGPCRNSFACRQPVVDSEHRFKTYRLNSDVAACLASSSAVSLPGTLILCPSNQSKCTLLKVKIFSVPFWSFVWPSCAET